MAFMCFPTAGLSSAPSPGKVYVRVVNVRCSLTFCIWKLPVFRANLPIVAWPGEAPTGQATIASPSSAVLDWVALPQPPEANPTGYPVTPAIYALVARLPQPPETIPAAVDQSA